MRASLGWAIVSLFCLFMLSMIHIDRIRQLELRVTALEGAR